MRLRAKLLRRLLVILAIFLTNAALPWARAADPLEEIFEHVYPMRPGASLTIHNADGAIRIYGSDVPQLELHALKKAYTAERLHEIQIDVRSAEDGIAIETKFPKRDVLDLRDRSGTVDYVLVIPVATKIREVELANGELLLDGLRGGSARAHLANGWMGCHNCFENLEASLGNGRLDVAYDWSVPDLFTAQVSATNGNLRALFPPDGPLTLSARTTTGRIIDRLTSGRNGDAENRSLSLRLGHDRGATIHLVTTNGNIEVEPSYEISAAGK